MSVLGPTFKDLEKWGSTSRRRFRLFTLTKGEIFLAVLLGCLTELQFVRLPVKSIIATTLACIAGLVYTVSKLRTSKQLPCKLFYVDVPVTGLAKVGQDHLLLTGGGGGLAYGVEDSTRLFTVGHRCENDFLPINLSSQINDQLNMSAASSLTKTNIFLGDVMPMTLLWGLSGSRNGVFAGGHKSSVLIGRANKGKLEAMLRHELFKDPNRIVHRTSVSECGHVVAAISESGDVCVYGVRGANASWERFVPQGEVALLGWLKVDSPVTVQVLNSDTILVVGNNGDLHPFRLSTNPSEDPHWLATGDTWGGPVSVYHVPILKSMPAVTLPTKILPKHCQWVSTLKTSKGTSHEVVIGAHLVPTRRGEKSAAVVAKCGLSDDSQTGVSISSFKIVKMPLNGITCLSLSDDKKYLGMASNDKFLTVHTRSLKVSNEIPRSPMGTKEESFLPSTSCVFSGGYFLVGGGDYSVGVVALEGRRRSIVWDIFCLERFVFELCLLWLLCCVTCFFFL